MENRSLKFKIGFKLLVAFFYALILAGQASAEGASFYLSPGTGNYRAGENFSVNLFLKTGGVSINAAQSTIKFPQERLEVVNISKTGSIFTLWFQESVWSNSRGEISFGGGLPSPGYRGEAGRIITIVFRGKSEGEARVIFEKGVITANDPWGTNVFSFGQQGVYAIFPAEKAKEDIDKKPPPALVEIIEKDKEPPLPFEIIIDNEGDPTNPQPLLYFKTTDELSGISHYELKIGEEDFFRLAAGETMPYRSHFLFPGDYPVLARAFDKAGNYIDSQAEVKIESILVPEITLCPKTYNAGEEILYLGGTALPEQTVIIFLKRDQKIIKSWEVYSTEKGEWFLEEESLFRPGVYRISARAKDSRGAISDFSQECFVEIFLGGFVFGPWIIGYKHLTLFALIFLAFVLFGNFYLFWKIKKNQRSLGLETKDLKQKFLQEYKELSRDIEKEMEVLRKLRGKRRITEKEKKREAELLRNLADIKKVFEKELKDIEEIK